jgi:Tfp pilus assembly protein PilN
LIKVNLKQAGKSKQSLVADIDLSGLNIKTLLICLLVGFAPKWVYFETVWEEEIQTKQAVLVGLNQKEAALKKQLKESEELVSKLEALKQREAGISKRLEIINKVLKKKRNPMKIMLYVAENSPDDVWLSSLVMQEETLRVNGYALTFKNIGSFIKNLNDSVFFAREINLQDYNTKNLEGANVQEFFLNGRLKRLD